MAPDEDAPAPPAVVDDGSPAPAGLPLVDLRGGEKVQLLRSLP